MPERTPGERPSAEQLIDELWPAPPPPSDLTARVMAAMAAGEGAAHPRSPGRPVRPAAASPVLPLPAPTTEPVPAIPASVGVRRRPRRATLLAGALAAAGVVLVGGWWLRFGDGPSEQGEQVARTRTTVTIAQRAAAAMEPGADLVWSVRRRAVRVDQRRGSVFYRVDRGGPFRVVTPAGEVEVTGTCFRVTLGGGAATLSAMTTMVSVLEGSVKVGAGIDA